MDNNSNLTARKMSRMEFEMEACLRILASIAMKDSISHVDQAQMMAQTMADAMQRRGFFGESNAVTEETRALGVLRYQPQRRTPQNMQQREAVEVIEQF